jgi:hypothetical protein
VCVGVQDRTVLLVLDLDGVPALALEGTPLHRAWTAWLADPASGPPPCGWAAWKRCPRGCQDSDRGADLDASTP